MRTTNFWAPIYSSLIGYLIIATLFLLLVRHIQAQSLVAQSMAHSQPERFSLPAVQPPGAHPPAQVGRKATPPVSLSDSYLRLPRPF